MFCTKCGKELAENAKFCNACGTPNPLAAAPAAPVQEPVTPVIPVAQEPVAPVVETPVAAPVVETPVAAPVAAPAAPKAAPVAAPVAPKAAPVAAPAAPKAAPVVIAEPAAPQKKSKKGLVILLCILIPLLIAGGVFAWLTIDKNNKTEMLEEANEAIEDGEYDDAVELLSKLGDFEGADQLLAQLNAYMAAQDALLEGNYEQALELLEQAGDFEDAEDILDDLEDDLRDYDKAVKALEKHDFAKAEELLRKLKSFKDSKKLLASIPFEKAMLLMESALGENYQEGLKLLESEGYYTGGYEEAQARRWMLEEAASRFENLQQEGYKYDDAASYRNECWFQLGMRYAEENYLYDAENYLERLKNYGADALAAELEAYIDSFYADAKFLDMLKAALEERMKLAEGGNVAASKLLEAEKEVYKSLKNMDWRDEDLESYFWAYSTAMDLQEDALSSDGQTIEDVSLWYYGTYMRCECIEWLNRKYSFLEEVPELKEIYVGTKMLYNAYSQLEASLNSYLGDGSIYQDYETGEHYMEIYNSTDFVYTLQLDFEFYDENGELVATYQGEAIEIPQYEYTQIWITFPPEVLYWESWNFYWTYSDIYFNGELIG